jgi:hypothetical protein
MDAALRHSHFRGQFCLPYGTVRQAIEREYAFVPPRVSVRVSVVSVPADWLRVRSLQMNLTVLASAMSAWATVTIGREY